MELRDFWECLFEESETTCLAENAKGVDTPRISLSLLYDKTLSAHQFFSINSINSYEDKMPIESWHSINKPRRADCNVTSYRNILVEMDKMSLDQQDQYISEIGMPYSTAVYSGGKSIHYIISLESPLLGAQEYRNLVERIYRAVGRGYVDLVNKNPSRLSRVPGHIRTDTGKEQKLLAVRGRLPNEALEDWLLSRFVDKKAPENDWETVPKRPTGKRDFSALYPSTRNFLMSGAPENWNLTLFKAAADFCRNGWTVDEALIELKKITGTLDGNDVKTIRSAFRNEGNRA